MKHLALCLALLIAWPLSAQAQKQCVQYLKPTSTLTSASSFISKTPPAFEAYFNSTAQAKLIGLEVKDSQGETHMFLGPIIGSGHRMLLERAEHQLYERHRDITEVLWAGEMRVQKLPQGLVAVLEINEVAGLNAQLQNGAIVHLQNSSHVQNAVEFLSHHPRFMITSKTRIERFDAERSSHLLEYVSAKDFRHTLGNQFNVMTFVEMVNMGRLLGPESSPTMTTALAQNFKSIIEFIQVFTREVGLPLKPQEQTALDQLVAAEAQILRAQNIIELQEFVAQAPYLYESLTTAYRLFMGALTHDYIVDTSSL